MYSTELIRKKVKENRDYEVYIDPMVFKYKHSWND